MTSGARSRCQGGGGALWKRVTKKEKRKNEQGGGKRRSREGDGMRGGGRESGRGVRERGKAWASDRQPTIAD